MTYEEWKSTARRVEDVAEIPHADEMECVGPLLVYEDDSFIEIVERGYHVVVGNDDLITEDREEAELFLWEWHAVNNYA